MSRLSESVPFQPALLTEEGRQLRFTLHQHIGPHLHFDFRFELGPDLADFAGKHGPSSEPEARVRMIRMHDHPKSILDFEGVMTKDGAYAGQMIISDQGGIAPVMDSEEPFENVVRAALESGFLLFEVFGRKMRGQYILQKEDEEWSLRKVSDAWNLCFKTEDLQTSVVSGRRIFELDGTPAWLEPYHRFRG